MTEKGCIVKDSIELISLLMNQYDEETRESLNRMRKVLLEISLGKGLIDHITAIHTLAEALAGEAKRLIGMPVLFSLKQREDEFLAHITHRSCPANLCFLYQPPPCQEACPAHIDIPTFIALIGQGRYDDATDVILKDMPFPWACGLICPGRPTAKTSTSFV